MAAPSQLEFHSRVLRLNIFIAKHCTIKSSNAHELGSPPGLLRLLRRRTCRGVVHATRGEEALPTPGVPKAFVSSAHRLGQQFACWLHRGDREASSKWSKQLGFQEQRRHSRSGPACGVLQVARPDRQRLCSPSLTSAWGVASRFRAPSLWWYAPTCLNASFAPGQRPPRSFAFLLDAHSHFGTLTLEFLRAKIKNSIRGPGASK